MGRFLCFPVNYNCLISFWKLKAGGLPLAEARVSTVKGQLQDVPYSSELTRSVAQTGPHTNFRVVQLGSGGRELNLHPM